MRRGVLGALVAAAACVVPAAPAGAQQSIALDLSLSGSLVATWHGDPARGCAVTGVCAFSGSATFDPRGMSSQVAIAPGASASEGVSSIDASSPSVIVRVARTDSSGARAGLCLDALQVSDLPVTLTLLGGSRVAVGLGQDAGTFAFLEGPFLSSGRCAGPLGTDLARLLPTTVAVVPARGRSGRVDLSGQRSFSAGPFSGELRSTLVLGVRRSARRGITSEEVPTSRRRRGHNATRLVRRVSVVLGYSAASSNGVIETTLNGGSACASLDTCGSRGLLTYAFAARSGGAGLFGSAALRGAPPRDFGSALLYVARHGRLDGGVTLSRLHGSTQERLSFDGASCADAVTSVAPDVQLGARRGRLTLDASQANPQADDLRTRCPGPTESDVFPDGSIAHAVVSASRLLRQRPVIPLRVRRSLDGGGFAGTTSGGMILRLRRTDARFSVYTTRVRVRRTG